MINLWKKEDLNSLSEYPKEVVENVDNVITILNESYGDNKKRKYQLKELILYLLK